MNRWVDWRTKDAERAPTSRIVAYVAKNLTFQLFIANQHRDDTQFEEKIQLSKRIKEPTKKETNNMTRSYQTDTNAPTTAKKLPATGK